MGEVGRQQQRNQGKACQLHKALRKNVTFDQTILSFGYNLSEVIYHSMELKILKIIKMSKTLLIPKI